MPIQVAAGCVFDFFPAFLICHISSVLAQVVVIVVWRRMGKRLEKWLPIDTNSNGSVKPF